jgi:hypothetical protein
MNETESELLSLTEQMLAAMYTDNSDVHRKHCMPDMSSYEWYIAPYRIDGADFHFRLIEAGGNAPVSQLDMLTPRVQVYGDAAIVNYTLLKTVVPEGGSATFSTINETRVFVRQDGIWKMAHLHKSPAA